MKKRILLLAIILCGLYANCQIVFLVNSPESIVGSYPFVNAGLWGQNPDMNLSQNALQGELVFVRDSLLCEPALNADDINGNIAVIYRGGCEFGLKVYYAEQAGARGAIIVNTDTEPVGMAPGSSGDQVVIPAWMIGSDVGAMLRNAVSVDDPIEIFYGNKIGFLEYDVGFTKGDFLVSKYYTIPHAIARNSDDFTVDVGSWVRNYGTQTQDFIQLRADVFGGDSEYSIVSEEFALEGGDSLFVSLPIFGLDEYDLDRYHLRYEVTSENSDEFPHDNVHNAYFNIQLENLSLVPSDEEGWPIATQSLRAADRITFQTCMSFESPIASRLALRGFYFSAGTSVETDLIDAELLLVAYEWNDVFNADGSLDISQLVDISSEVYYFEEDLQQETVYIDVPFPPYLQNNQKYLFCVFTANSDVFLGFNSETNYDANLSELDYLYFPSYLLADANWFTGFIGSYAQPIITPKLVDTATLSLNKVPAIEAFVFPNPIEDKITVKIKQVDGPAQLKVSDPSGKVILEQSVVIHHGILELSHPELINGLYHFEIQLPERNVTRFNVLVSK